MGYETKTPNPTPPSLKTVEFWQFFFVFSDLIFRQKLEDKKSFFSSTIPFQDYYFITALPTLGEIFLFEADLILS